MDNLNKGFSILNADYAVGASPTQKTFRIAKALGYAAVLHLGDDRTHRTAPMDASLRARVKTARLAFHAADMAAGGLGHAQALAQIGELAASLPKPLLVICSDRYRAEAIVATASTSDDTSPRASTPAQSHRQAA